MKTSSACQKYILYCLYTAAGPEPGFHLHTIKSKEAPAGVPSRGPLCGRTYFEIPHMKSFALSNQIHENHDEKQFTKVEDDDKTVRF